MQEKRAKLIALSAEAKALRQLKIDTAQTVEEAVFWQTRTINYMLLNYIYPNAGQRFETFKEWKAQGATIKKGAKATIIWGQPRQGVAKPEQPEATTASATAAATTPTDDMTPEQYEFFPICFLFSEEDVFFTNAEAEAQPETTEAVPIAPTVPVIDSSAFNEL